MGCEHYAVNTKKIIPKHAKDGFLGFLRGRRQIGVFSPLLEKKAPNFAAWNQIWMIMLDLQSMYALIHLMIILVKVEKKRQKVEKKPP